MKKDDTNQVKNETTCNSLFFASFIFNYFYMCLYMLVCD